MSLTCATADTEEQGPIIRVGPRIEVSAGPIKGRQAVSLTLACLRHRQ